MSNPSYSSPINVAQPPYYGEPVANQQPQTHVVVTECHDHHHGGHHGHHNKSGCDDCCCIASLAVCCACCLACCSD